MKKDQYLDLLIIITSYKLRFILYLIAAVILLVPVGIVMVTDVPFNSFYSSIFFNTALIFIILGKISAVVRKNIEDKTIQWFSIGVIISLLFMVVSNIFL